MWRRACWLAGGCSCASSRCCCPASGILRPCMTAAHPTSRLGVERSLEVTTRASCSAQCVSCREAACRSPTRGHSELRTPAFRFAWNRRTSRGFRRGHGKELRRSDPSGVRLFSKLCAAPRQPGTRGACYLVDSRLLCLPTFLLVGFTKAGTSIFFSYLSQVTIPEHLGLSLEPHLRFGSFHRLPHAGHQYHDIR